MEKVICLLIAAAALIWAAGAEMPVEFTQAVNNGHQKDSLRVMNYDSGASLIEEYSNVERLERETQVRTGAYGPSSSTSSGGGLEASINSNVIGTAHIGWQSYDPVPDSKGRHQLLGRSVEDLTGVFSIEKFIQLWSNSSPGEISVDWLPCC
mgnify:FL=1